MSSPPNGHDTDPSKPHRCAGRGAPRGRTCALLLCVAPAPAALAAPGALAPLLGDYLLREHDCRLLSRHSVGVGDFFGLMPDLMYICGVFGVPEIVRRDLPC